MEKARKDLHAGPLGSWTGDREKSRAGGSAAEQRLESERPMDRRQFLKIAAGGAAWTAMAMLVGCGGSPAANKTTKRRLGMVIDLTRCTGCHACAVACKAEHNVRLGAFRSWVNQVETGIFPNVRRHFLPRLCNQCEESTCSKVCPTQATYERDDGIVMIDKDKCIGCRYCINACPYGSRYFNWRNEDSEDAARTPGVVDKCDFCVHRVDQGLEPACVVTCPARARTFGDLNDPESEISKIVATQPTSTLMPEYGTKPKVFYIGLDDAAVAGRPKGGR